MTFFKVNSLPALAASSARVARRVSHPGEVPRRVRRPRTVHAEESGDEGGVADGPGPRAELDRLAVGTQGGLVGHVKFRRDVEGFTSRGVRERVGARMNVQKIVGLFAY